MCELNQRRQVFMIPPWCNNIFLMASARQWCQLLALHQSSWEVPSLVGFIPRNATGTQTFGPGIWQCAEACVCVWPLSPRGLSVSWRSVAANQYSGSRTVCLRRPMKLYKADQDVATQDFEHNFFMIIVCFLWGEKVSWSRCLNSVLVELWGELEVRENPVII